MTTERRPEFPARLAPTRIGPRLFEWGTRTFVMGIVNVTPDSFSGDGLLAAGDGAGSPASILDSSVDRALAQAARMVEEGADILDVGGESTRPGHQPVSAQEEIGRVVPVIAALHARFPDVPISADTSKVAVARAALDAGASLLNDVWGVSDDPGMARLAAERGVPMVVMHNRAEARYSNVIAEVIADLRKAIGRAEMLGVPPENVIVDPGFGFGKTPEHNLEVLRGLGRLRELGRPILLGTSRKSTIGKVLGGLPPDQRLEGTLATTAAGIAAGVDIVRVHDVLANVRAARMTDAIFGGATPMTDRIALVNMRFQATHGVLPGEQVHPQPFEVDVEIFLDLRPAGSTDDLSRTADYRLLFEICRETVEEQHFRLIESIAETIAGRVLREIADSNISEVIVRVRKPAVALPGSLDAAAVEIRRTPADVR